jgi:hypothetical protein
MCNMHYLRVMKHGSTSKPLPTCPKGHRVEGGRCSECDTARTASLPTCVINDCTDVVLARGWCRKHYLRWYRLGSTDTPPRFTEKACSVDGCDCVAIKHGWCSKHHARWKKRGTTDAPPPKPTACAVEGCDKTPTARGWCKRHHKFFTRQGVEHEMRRYALKCGSQVGPVDYDAILAGFGMVCHLCGGQILTRRDLNFDHVIPLTRGGPHVQENIRPSHKKCNASKGNKLMSEFAGGGDEAE